MTLFLLAGALIIMAGASALVGFIARDENDRHTVLSGIATAVAVLSAAGAFASVTTALIMNHDAKAEAQAKYRAAAAARLDTTHGLRPLSQFRTDVPNGDNQTRYGVRMEHGDELVECLLNTRTGPGSITAHCKPYRL